MCGGLPPGRYAKSGLVRPFIVIIADQGISACTKYRVTQRKEHLEKIGWKVLVIEPISGM